MDAEFKINVGVEIPGFLELIKEPSAQRAFPTVFERLNDLTRIYQETWKRYALGNPIPGVPRIINSGKYASSIHIDISKPDEKIIYTTYKNHQYIEKGHGEIDLKPGLLKGQKARIGKSGPFNVVAFRHGAPKSEKYPMPVNIYNIVRQFEQGAVKATTKDAQGIDRRSYTALMSKLPKESGGAPEIKKISEKMREHLEKVYGGPVEPEYTWKSGKYAGLIRMQANTTKAKSSMYMTFRCVSRASNPASWIVPSVPPIPIRQAVVNTMRPITDKAIAQAFEIDLARQSKKK